jgi:signal transduction histidine kinase
MPFEIEFQRLTHAFFYPLAYTLLMGRQSFSPPPRDLILRTRWYVYIRWFFIVAIGAPSLITLYALEGLTPEVILQAGLGAIALLTNGVFFILSRRNGSRQYFRALAAMVLLADIAVISTLIFTRGGIESRSTILYVLPIMMSATIFGRRGIYGTTVSAIVAYSVIVAADYYGVVQTFSPNGSTLREDMPHTLQAVTFISAIIAVVGFTVDFLTRLLLDKERQALESAEALSRAQAIAKLGSWELDLKTDDLLWSDELYRIFGLPTTGTPITFSAALQYIHPEDRKAVEQQVRSAQKTGQSFKINHRIKTPDKQIRFVHNEGHFVFDRKGRPIKMIGIIQDLTAERALDQAKNEFVSLASHQLRTPATGVKAFLALLTDGYAGQLNEKQRQFLESAYEANERQLSIINDLLSVASIESGRIILRKELSDIGKITQTCVEEHRAHSKKQEQEILLSLPQAPIKAYVDQSRFRMILDNLISNASKYTPHNGKITIHVRKQAGKAIVDVKDTGSGIAKKDMHKLFGKFSRIENVKNLNVDGSGLGLYLAKYLSELHDGDILVKSRLGRGSTFSVKVPIGTKRSGKRLEKVSKSTLKVRNILSRRTND